MVAKASDNLPTTRLAHTTVQIEQCSSGVVYVDDQYTGISVGTAAQPFKTVSSAVHAACAGAELHIKHGPYFEALMLNKPLRVVAEGGSVTIAGSGLVVTPEHTMLFNALSESGDPRPQEITVKHVGGAPLNWTANVSAGTNWLAVDKQSGSTPDQISVSVKTTGLAVDNSYQGAIEISTPGVPGSLHHIAVTLRYGSNLGIAVTPGDLNFTMVAGQAVPPAQTLVIQGGTGAWSATSDQGWLKTTGDSSTGASLQVQVVPQNLGIGNYTGQIRFDGNAQGLPRSVPVQFAITEQATPPQCQKTDFVIVNSLQSSLKSLKLVDIFGTPNSDGSCKITAKLVIDLPQNKQISVGINGTIDAQKRLDAVMDANDEVTIAIASVKLQLNNIHLNNEGLEADATWQLDSATPGAGKVRMDKNGLSFAGSQSFVFNPTVGISQNGFNIQLQQATLGVVDNSYTLALHGSIAIGGISGLPSATANATLTLNQSGVRNTKISAFSLSGLAGLNLAVGEGELSSVGISAASAAFTLPPAWGGASIKVTGVKIPSDGKIKIGSGSFKLPTIQVGEGFSLTSLEGSFEPENGNLISANGAFKLPLGSGSGSCTLEVGVKLRTGSSGAGILEISSANMQNTTGLVLNQIKLGLWDCPIRNAIAIGTTGFYLTGVRGNVILNQGISSVQIEVQVRSSLEFAGKPALRAEASALIKTRPPSLDFRGVVYALGLKAAETKVYIGKADGFSANLVFEYAIFHGNFQVDAWSKSGQMYVTGRGKAYAIIQKGEFGKGCVDALFKKFCANIPPSDWKSPVVNSEFGAFKNGAFGFKGSVAYKFDFHGTTLFNFRGGFYVDGDGRLTFGNVDKYVLTTRPQVAAARARYEARQSGIALAATSALDGQITFDANRSIRIAVPVAAPTRVASATQPYSVAVQSDLLFVMAQPLTGTLTIELIDPAGNLLTPNNLPNNVAFASEPTDNELQLTYGVAEAQPGVWQMRINGDTDHIDYVVMVLGNTPPPLLSASAIPQTINLDQVNVQWNVQSTATQAKINIYASPESLTRTLVFTDANGIVTTQTVDNYMGAPLATDLPTMLDGSTQSQSVDLSGLATGVYHLWIEVDDSKNPPTRQQLITVNVDHRATFPASAVSAAVTGGAPPASWTTTLNTQEDIANGELQIQWMRHLHPDIDTYHVHLRSVDPLAPTAEVIETYTVGDVSETSIGGIEPGRTYQIAIGIEDMDTGKVAWSQETAVTTSQPEFFITKAATVASIDSFRSNAPNAIPIHAGQQITIPIALQLPDNLPDPVALIVDYTQAPVNFDVALSQNVVLASGEVGVGVTVAPQQAAGFYPVPVIARSGSLVRNLILTLQVLPDQAALNYTLNINKAGNGTVILNPPGGVYTAGTTVQLTATPDTSYNFISWGGALSSTLNPINIIMDGDKTVTVMFAQTDAKDIHIYLPLIRR